MDNRKKIAEMVDLLRWVLAICWRINKVLFVAFFVVTMVTSFLPAGAALAVRGLVNEVSNSLVSGNGNTELISLWLTIGFVTALALVLGEATQRLITQQYRTELSYQLQLDIFAHNGALDYAYFEDPKFKDTLQRAKQQPSQHLANLLEILFGFLYKTFQIGSLLVILFLIEPVIIFMLIPIGVPYLWFQWWLSKRKFEETDVRIENRRWLSYYGHILNQESLAAEIKLYNLAPIFIERSQLLLQDFRQLEKRFQWITFGGISLFAVLSIAGVYYALARATFAVVEGGLTIGDIAIYGAAATRLRGQLEGLVSLVSSFRWETLHIRNLRKYFDVNPRLIRDGDLIPESNQGEIEFRNVSFAYPSTEKLILADVSFKIRPGETVAVVGSNGAGKTTIAKLIARFYDPTSGEIFVDQHPIKTFKLKHLRRQIAFVFQQFGRYAATAADNIAFGDWESLLDDRPLTQEMAQKFGVADLINSFPDKYDTMLGRNFGHLDLSGGQWQQMAIARAMTRDAAILVLDEPTASLDVQTEYRLFKRFKQMAENRTTILISHRFSTVKMADRILVLDDGKIVENGTHDELIGAGQLYSRLYNLHHEQMESTSPALEAEEIAT